MYDLTDSINLINKEYQHAILKYPDFHSQHEAYAVLLEELDELFYKIKNNDSEGAFKEAAHVGAMALRFLVDL